MMRPEEEGTKKDLVLYHIQTARDDLKAARILLQAEQYKSTNNRAYYAIFHAINAIHAVNGKAYKRHKDAVANFNKDYVKTEIFPREMGRKIGEAEEIRHASDYDDFYIASREEAERQITVADEFIQLSEKYCMEELKKEERDSVSDQNVDGEVDINGTVDSLTGSIPDTGMPLEEYRTERREKYETDD